MRKAQTFSVHACAVLLNLFEISVLVLAVKFFEQVHSTCSMCTMYLTYKIIVAILLCYNVFLQVASIRQHLASIYERAVNWREAASALVGIPLETAQK